MTVNADIRDLYHKVRRLERLIAGLMAGAGEANTGANVGAGGVGPYDGKVGVQLQFRNINAAAAGRITVALDAPNNEIDLDVDPSAIDLNDLGDVNVPAPANNEVLTWIAAANEWQAAAGGAGGGAENWWAHRKSERYYASWDNYGMTTMGLNIDYIYAAPFLVPIAQNFDRIALYVYGSTNRVVRLGIYEDDGNCYPGDLVVGTAEFDCSSSACQEEAIDEDLPAGLYWLSVLNGVAAGNIRGLYYQYSVYSVIGRTACNDLVPPVSYWKSQAYGAMPDPFPASASESDTNVPAIMLRKS